MASAKRRRVATGIYELERGVYELVVSLGRGADGRYRQRTQRLKGTLTEAKRARARLLTADEPNDRPADPEASMRFRDLLNLHLERMAASGHSPRTIEDYGVHIRVHLGPALGDIPIDRLRALDLDRLYDRLSTERGLRPATVRKIHNTARGALRQAVRWGLVTKNVAVDASPPSIRRTEIRVPSPDRSTSFSSRRRSRSRRFCDLPSLLACGGVSCVRSTGVTLISMLRRSACARAS
jgi:integrase